MIAGRLSLPKIQKKRPAFAGHHQFGSRFNGNPFIWMADLFIRDFLCSILIQKGFWKYFIVAGE
jgi:hypothetical protein